MNTRNGIKGMLIIFCAMFVILSVYLVYTTDQYGTRWFASPYNSRVNAQKNNVIAGDILDRNGTALATTDSNGDRVYPSDTSLRLSTAHVVGDNYGQTFGAENFFSKYLLGFDQSVFTRVSETLSGKPGHGSDVVLTIDSRLCDTAYSAMGDYSGAALLINYQTGEILASVSKPSFDLKYVADYLNKKKDLDSSAMVNRVNSGKYTPGSVFKMVTALAAIRYLPGVAERTFHCDGPLVFDATTGKYLPDVHFTPEQYAQNDQTKAGMIGDYRVVRDYDDEYHGDITFAQAFAKSCNHVFAQLAMEIGPDKLARVAHDVGVDADYLFSDMVTATGSFEKATTDVNVAWSGVGQYTDITTPLSICLLAGSVGNGGVMMEPKLLEEVKAPSGAVTNALKPETESRAMSAAEAATLADLMTGVVETGTGRSAKVAGVTVAGKTGTAEVSAGDKAPNAWFAGFVRDSKHPLAVCVVLENGGSGGSHAAPIAAQLLKRAIVLGY